MVKTDAIKAKDHVIRSIEARIMVCTPIILNFYIGHVLSLIFMVDGNKKRSTGNRKGKGRENKKQTPVQLGPSDFPPLPCATTGKNSGYSEGMWSSVLH